MVALSFLGGRSKVIYKFLTVQDVGAPGPRIVQGSTVLPSIYSLQEDFGCFSYRYTEVATCSVCYLSL